MKLVEVIVTKDFCLFALGVFGLWIAPYVHKCLKQCPEKLFSAAFVLGTYILIHILW